MGQRLQNSTSEVLEKAFTSGQKSKAGKITLIACSINCLKGLNSIVEKQLNAGVWITVCKTTLKDSFEPGNMRCHRKFPALV